MSNTPTPAPLDTSPYTPKTKRGHSYRDHAVWYAFGYADSLRRHAEAELPGFDPFGFGYWAARLADDYTQSTTTFLSSIQDLFTQYLGSLS